MCFVLVIFSRLEIVVDPWISGLWIALRLELGLSELANGPALGNNSMANDSATAAAACNGDGAAASAAAVAQDISSAATASAKSNAHDVSSAAAAVESLSLTEKKAVMPAIDTKESNSLSADLSSTASSVRSEEESGAPPEMSFRDRLHQPSSALSDTGMFEMLLSG